MIPVSPNPILFTIGSISVRFYGLIYSLGFILAYWFLLRAKQFNKLRLTRDEIDSFVLLAIIGGIIGGRLGEFIFFEPRILITDPLEILKIWHGGMSIHGGIIGLSLVVFLFSKKHELNPYDLTDILVIPASISLAFGRLANFMNGELLGTITNLPWAINWFGEKTSSGVLIGRHPSTIYEAIKNTFVFLILIFIDNKINNSKRIIRKPYVKRKRKVKNVIEEKTSRKINSSKKTDFKITDNSENKFINNFYYGNLRKGYLTWLFIFLFDFLRIITDVWRDDVKWFLGFLSTGQVLSLVLAIISLVVLIKFYWTNKQN